MVAALTMTSEREEVIDFVAPYFEQSGILIGKKFLFGQLLVYRVFLTEKNKFHYIHLENIVYWIL